ncbi:predicted protein [Coccidioides posadasii str. Silveira]|uniref:Predicted protein n=1 Tax=Coccidioides posadasii (strain RMSCC 757 / Silveira) TaxID=443226 RepID=E9CY41_COCPS|nr:predicted protein [Coccidioides posadasii str. Silveira]
MDGMRIQSTKPSVHDFQGYLNAGAQMSRTALAILGKRLLGNVPVFRGPRLLPPSQVGGGCRGDLPTLKTKSSTTLPSSGSVRLPSLDQIISQAAEEAACAIGLGDGIWGVTIEIRSAEARRTKQGESPESDMA